MFEAGNDLVVGLFAVGVVCCRWIERDGHTERAVT